MSTVSSSIGDNITHFFTPPETITPDDGPSVLCLLRREIQECLVGSVRTEGDLVEQLINPCDHPATHHLFASTMLMLTGIDLLAKFYAGCDSDGVGKRFNNFAQKYIPHTPEDALYALRNSLLHSFGLYNKDKKLGLSNSPPSGPNDALHTAPSVHDKADGLGVYIPLLYRDFVGAIEGYKDDLRCGEDKSLLQDNFARMHPKYGTLRITSTSTPPATPCTISTLSPPVSGAPEAFPPDGSLRSTSGPPR